MNALYSRKQEFLTGVRDTFPLLLGAFPFGLIYGVLALTSGLSLAASMAMSALVFAGSAQFVAVGLVSAQAPLLIIILTTFIVNLRHMLYSATLLPHYSTSMGVLDKKMANAADVEPDYIASGCPGCQMQLTVGCKRTGLNAEIVHPVQLLDRAYGDE